MKVSNANSSGFVTHAAEIIYFYSIFSNISRIFRLAKVSLVKFSQIKLFFDGPLTREFVHFAVNYSGGSFLEMSFSRFGNGKISRGEVLLQVVSQTLRSFADSPSSKFPNFFESKFVAII